MDNVDKNYFELKRHGIDEMPMELYEGDCSVYKDCYIHWHEEMEIIYVEDGKTHVSINDKNIYGNQGDLIFIEKGAVHYIQNIDTDNVLKFRTLVFNINMLFLSEENYCQKHFIAPLMNCNIMFSNIISPNDKNYKKILSAYLSLIEAYKKKEEFYEIHIISLMYNLFYEMLVGDHVLQREQTSRKNQRVIKRCLAYVDQNYQNHITVKEVSTMVNFSESYFMHAFSEYTGKSLITYINEVRLDKAKNMLSSTDKSISDISFDCGFQSTSYFIKLFKKQNGLTPVQYRKKFQ